MTLGEKIRARRKALGLTQKDVAGTAVTRNMICAIERGDVSPSLSTLASIAQALSVPIEYLVSSEEDLTPYLVQDVLPKLRSAYSSRRYADCITICRRLPEKARTNEAAYLAAASLLALAERAIDAGNLASVPSYISEAQAYTKMTALPCAHLLARAEIYRSIAANPQTPKWEISTDRYLTLANEAISLEKFRYLSDSDTLPIQDQNLREHIEAKELVSRKRYAEALRVLLAIEDRKSSGNIGSYLLFRVYTDIETCYRELRDYENAYRYSTKRLSLLSAFRE